MSSDIGPIRLRELSFRITKGTTPTKGEGFVASGINYIKSESITADGSIDESKFAFIDEATHNKLARSQLRAGNVLFSMAGIYLGKTAVVLPKHLPANTNQAVGVITLDESKADPYFVHYSLQSPTCRAWVLRSAAQSAQPNFNLQEIGDLKVPAFPLAKQKEIASILRRIDDRIALLRETNATLEAIAQALFKSWFVDFDPVHARARGEQPEGLPEPLAALFPDSFEESPLGLVPRGWRVGSIGEFAEVIDCLHSKKPELLASGQPFLQLSNIRDDGLLDTSKVSFVSEADYQKWISRIEVRGGDCVITNVGRVGAVAQIPVGFCAAMGRNMTAIRPKTNWPYPTFLVELLQSPCMREEIKRRTDVGTILDALNVRNIPLLRSVLAPHPVMLAFEEHCRPLRAAMEANLSKANTLASLRDTLLPRLISGQLRLPEAEALAEEVQA